MSGEWVTFRVTFYDRSAEDRFLRSCQQQKNAVQFFFTRLFHQGPFLLLRWRVSTPNAQKEIRERIQSALDECPGRVELSKEEYCRRYLPNDWIDGVEWMEDGMIIEGTYEPEVARYGGALCLKEVEAIFHLTCQWILSTSLELLERAMLLNQVLLRYLLMPESQLTEYLFAIGDTWAQHMYASTGSWERHRAHHLSVAQSTVLQRKESFDRLQVDAQFRQDPGWIEYVNRVGQLREIAIDHSPPLLITPPDSERMTNFQAAYKADFTFPRIVASLMHMNCNRAGIPTHAEPAFYYIMAMLSRERQGIHHETAGFSSLV